MRVRLEGRQIKEFGVSGLDGRSIAAFTRTRNKPNFVRRVG